MRTFLGCAVLAFGAAAGPAPADNVLELRVGETRHMTVYIADNCKGKPPAWVNVKRKLPKSKIVTFSDGDLGPRRSDRCGGEVVGREIDATGMKPGKETLKAQSGKLTVIVRQGPPSLSRTEGSPPGSLFAANMSAAGWSG